MQNVLEYRSEIKTVPFGNRTITIKNLMLVLPPKERERRRKEIEQRLFDVFSKYRVSGSQIYLNSITKKQKKLTIYSWTPHK